MVTIKARRKDEPKISKVLLTILDERFAKLLFTLKAPFPG